MDRDEKRKKLADDAWSQAIAIGKKASKRQLAKTIVKRIIEDLEGRSGLGNEWEYCDSDVQAEIKQTWSQIVEKELASALDGS